MSLLRLTMLGTSLLRRFRWRMKQPWRLDLLLAILSIKYIKCCRLAGVSNATLVVQFQL